MSPIPVAATTIARAELRMMLRDGRFRVAGLAIAVLLGAALVTGWVDRARVAKERAAAQAISRAQWEAQGEKNPHSAAHYSIYAFRPRPALSFVDPGIDPYVGIGVWLEAHKQNEFRYRPARDMTAAARAGRATAALVLQLLVPLVIVMLTAPALAGEREGGMLALLMSLGVRPRTVLFGKAGGLAAALGLLLVPAAFAGAAALTQLDAEGDVAIRAALMAGGYLAYFAAFLSIGLAVSAIASNSRLALLVLLGFWVANALAPRVTTDLARWLYPLPAASELTAAVAANLREGIDGHNPEGKRLEELTARVLAEYQVASLDALPVNFDGIVLQAGEDYGNRVFDAHYARLWASIARQTRVHLLGALAAPLPAVQAWSRALAGTDWMHQQRFAAAAERYRRDLVRRMNEELIYRSTSRNYGQNVRAGELWATLGDFRYSPPSIGEVVEQQTASIGLLAGWCAVGAVLAAYAGERLARRP